MREMKIAQRGKYAERDTIRKERLKRKKMIVAKNRVELQTQWAVMVRTAASSRLRSSGAATPSPVNLKGTTVSSRELLTIRVQTQTGIRIAVCWVPRNGSTPQLDNASQGHSPANHDPMPSPVIPHPHTQSPSQDLGSGHIHALGIPNPWRREVSSVPHARLYGTLGAGGQRKWRDASTVTGFSPTAETTRLAQIGEDENDDGITNEGCVGEEGSPLR